MFESSQIRRQQRISLVKRLISNYDGEGVDFNQFKALLEINYGFSHKRALEYLKLLEDGGMIEINRDIIKIKKQEKTN